MNSIRSLFITAYCWMFGSTKKAAAEAFKKHMDARNECYIKAVIESFENNARKSFYDD